jgi:hypothetical protein
LELDGTAAPAINMAVAVVLAVAALAETAVGQIMVEMVGLEC